MGDTLIITVFLTLSFGLYGWQMTAGAMKVFGRHMRGNARAMGELSKEIDHLKIAIEELSVNMVSVHREVNKINRG